ncbi:MAG: phosphoenolpyruvate hydrolase family protein [Thermovirgaceae bacterium]
MAKQYPRTEVLARLKGQVDKGKALLLFGAGTGLTAKCAEKGGADLICVYSTARCRMSGRPSLLAWLPYGDCNQSTFEMAGEILPMIKEAPCIAGLGAHDPTLDLDYLVEEALAHGFSGVTNEPFAGMYGEAFGTELERAGMGFSREVELVRTARRRDVFTLAWAFSAEEGKAMAEAGADVIGAMIGVTSGGFTGAGKTASLEEAVQRIREICDAVRDVNPNTYVVTHGGPIKDLESAELSIRQTSAVGYVAGSSGERIPTERAIVDLTKRFKDIGI